MPHVEVSAGTVFTMLGLITLIVQPGAIPFTYAMVTRHLRRGGQRPQLVAVGSYLLGCVFTLLCVAAFFCAEFPMLVGVLLSYGAMLLFAYLIMREPAVEPTGRHARS